MFVVVVVVPSTDSSEQACRLILSLSARQLRFVSKWIDTSSNFENATTLPSLRNDGSENARTKLKDLK